MFLLTRFRGEMSNIKGKISGKIRDFCLEIAVATLLLRELET